MPIADLEPATRHFVESLAASGGFPLSARCPASIRSALSGLQSGLVGKPSVAFEDVEFPTGSSGSVGVRIIRPEADYARPAPVIMYFHGGGWVAGDIDTHDRLLRELAVLAKSAVVFVKYDRAPEARFPLALEQAYAATAYVVDHARQLQLDGKRIAVVGDGAGGTLAAAVALLCKQRRGPKILFQVLFYPATTIDLVAASPQDGSAGWWLTKEDMAWFWGAYLPNEASRAEPLAAPLNATLDQLRGLPDSLLITAEMDVLRDEGEAYARKLAEANVRTTCTRYLGTIHDFMMLNALADTPATRGALCQAASALKFALA